MYIWNFMKLPSKCTAIWLHVVIFLIKYFGVTFQNFTPKNIAQNFINRMVNKSYLFIMTRHDVIIWIYFYDNVWKKNWLGSFF